MGSMWQLASSASLAGELEKDGIKWGMPRGGVHWRKGTVLALIRYTSTRRC
ncbi:hypothetical protein QR685DRAFT_537320, partial [Neurospora intermedia]